MKYKQLMIANPAEPIFGKAPRPMTTRRGLVLGGGTVYMELNFTLPTITINESSLPEVYRHYDDTLEEAGIRNQVKVMIRGAPINPIKSISGTIGLGKMLKPGNMPVSIANWNIVINVKLMIISRMKEILLKNNNMRTNK